MTQVEVRYRITGSITDPTPVHVILDLLNEEITVSELIAQTVEEQIRDLLIHRKLDVEDAQRILNRQYLTDADVHRQAEGGAVRHPSPKSITSPSLDTPAEIQKALRAFEQGTYLIIADGRQMESLNEVLSLRPMSKITFLRLTPLAGG